MTTPDDRVEPSMADDRGGFRLVRAGPGSPLVIGFGIEGTPIDRAIEARPGIPEVGRIDLRDRLGDGFYGGVVGLGDTIEGAVSALASIIDELSPDRIITIGQGFGGHAALVYGVLLGAGRIVSIEPFAHLVEEVLEVYNDRRCRQGLATMPDPERARRFEVATLIDRVGYRGHAHVLLGTRRVNDHEDAVHLNAIHAHWLARSPRVALHPFTEAAPGLLDWLVRREEAGPVLAQFLFDDIPGSTPPVDRAPSIRPRHPLMYDAKLTICKIEERDPANQTGGPVAYASAGEVDVTTTRKIDDEVRRWIAENLLLDASPEDLAKSLLSKGISRQETLMEVDLARFHPYFLATKRPMNRLSKRDWLIATYRKLNRLRRKSTRIERRAELSRDDFVKDYYSTGRPVILAGMRDDRPAPESWSIAELARRFGDGSEAADPGEGPGVREIPSEVWEAIGPSSPGRSLVDRAGGTFWLGPAGSSPPSPDERTAALMAPVVGRVRAQVVPWWDVLLMEEAMRTSPRPEEVLAEASHLTPIDRPEGLEFTLEPGEWLFLPAGCRARFECPDPSAMVSFDRFAFDAR